MAASISVAALVVMAGGCAASASSTRPEGTHHPTTVPAPAPRTTVAAPTTTGPPSAVPTTVPAPAVQAPGWSAPLTTLPPGGGFTSVSCISDTFCVAVGGGTDGDDSSLTAGSGVAVSWDGAAWSDPVVYFPAPASGPVTAPVLPSISCTSGPSCVIVDGSGHVSYGNGTTWSPPVALAAPPALPANPDDPGPGRAGSRSDALDCPTAGVCAFVDNTGHAYLLHGGAWAAPQTLGSSSGPGSATVSRYQPGRVGVSCPSPTSCTAVVGPSVLDWSGSSWSVEPAPWTSSLVSGAADPTAIACPSAGECLIVNGSGFAERTPGGGWSPEQTIDPHGELDGLSCPSTTFCMATDADGSVVSWNGSTWSAPVRVVPAATDYTGIGTSVSCPDTQFCMVMNSDGDYATYAGPGAH
jgi:hypothetical protein